MHALLLAAVLAQAGATNVPGVQFQDEGTSKGQVTKINCVGAGVTCSVSAPTGTLTVNAGGSWTTVEIDFGSGAQFVQKITVTDATVSSTSRIIAVQSGEAATGRQADENEMDALVCSGLPAAGSFTLVCSCSRSVTHGKFKIHYTVA